MSTTLCVASRPFLQLPKDTIQIGTQTPWIIIPAATDVSAHTSVTIAYFCLCALDVLNALGEKTTESQRAEWAEWIWSLQVCKLAPSQREVHG